MTKKKIIDKSSALLNCAELCSRAEHCEFEIRNKLYNWGLEADFHDEIIDYLFDHNFIDHERFAKAFTNDKVRFSAWGRIKIELALRQKRIPSYAISQAIAKIDEKQYISNLAAIISTKAKRFDLKDFNQRNAVYRQIAAKGYEPSMIVREINNYISANESV